MAFIGIYGIAAICIRSANCRGYGRLGDRGVRTLDGLVNLLVVMDSVIEGELCLESVSILRLKARTAGTEGTIACSQHYE